MNQETKIEDLQAQIRSLEAEKVERKKQVEMLRAKAEQIWRDEAKAVAELEKRLNEIRAPFRAQWSETEKEKKETEKRIRDISLLIEKLQAKIRLIEDEDKSVFDSAEGFRAFLSAHGIIIPQSHTVKMVVKPLRNGIRLFSHFFTWGEGGSASEATGIAWFAVFEKKIVGFHLTERGASRIDDTKAWAWINTPKLRRKNSIGGERRGLLGTYFTGIKQRDWRARLEAMEPSELVEIDLNDEVNKIVLASDEAPRFEDKKLSEAFDEDE